MTVPQSFRNVRCELSFWWTNHPAHKSLVPLDSARLGSITSDAVISGLVSLDWNDIIAVVDALEKSKCVIGKSSRESTTGVSKSRFSLVHEVYFRRECVDRIGRTTAVLEELTSANKPTGDPRTEAAECWMSSRFHSLSEESFRFPDRSTEWSLKWRQGSWSAIGKLQGNYLYSS